MKKLLTLLGSISVVASGGAVAVACGNAPTNDKIDRAEGEQADQAQKDGKAPNSGGQADQAQGDKAKANIKDEESSKLGGSNGEQNGKQLSKTTSHNLTQEEIRDNLIKEEKKNKELREKRKEKLENFKKTNEYKYYK
ncbi:Hypothetical Lipoprotein (VmcD) [Mycoplasma leachii 99/014/6]|uniref:lipoprotein n=1 Tax=Mycoplasma leachii TaxID=2105 RepID=UPI0002177155|nr:lipoprotein [Mycoplasma leachii]CBV67475.1 Hypothetical Lipoprotein (VmcD) [Mycoplasma leachii 99/014/6]